MKWIRAHRYDLSELVEFLRRQEWNCVAFSERVRSNGSPSLPSGKERVYLRRSHATNAIEGATLVSDSGLVFPVFSSAAQLPPDVTLPPGYTDGRLYSIMGLDSYVRAIETAVSRVSTYRINYDLMTLDPPPPAGEPGTTQSVRIRRATIDDLDRLFPLQKRYEREEVLLPNHRLNVPLCYQNLRETLQQQVVLLAEINGRVIGKANTNARGFRYDQVGGVFTERRFRNRGIATLLMRRLSRLIFGNRKKVCLFVKKDNPPALALYRRLGFRTRGDFTITYYN